MRTKMLRFANYKAIIAQDEINLKFKKSVKMST
jgi:hypothetical protein